MQSNALNRMPVIRSCLPVLASMMLIIGATKADHDRPPRTIPPDHFAYDRENRCVTLVWKPLIGGWRYSVRRSVDLVTWEEVDDYWMEDDLDEQIVFDKQRRVFTFTESTELPRAFYLIRAEYIPY